MNNEQMYMRAEMVTDEVVEMTIDERRRLIVYALCSSKSWMRGYAEAFVDSYAVEAAARSTGEARMNNEQVDMRAAFEAWESHNGKYPRAIERDSTGEYRLIQAACNWPVWQAAIAQQAESEPTVSVDALSEAVAPEQPE